jgi:hypothetical protein
MSSTHLTQHELARRWGLSPRTLERWRWTSQGPRFVKLIGRVVYPIEEVEAFEAARLRCGTSNSASRTPAP